MSRLGWYAHRLRAMGAREVGWRARRATSAAVRHSLLASGPPPDRAVLGDGIDWVAALERWRTADGRPVLLDRYRARALARIHPNQTAAVVVAADTALARRFTFFGYPEVTLDNPIDWHRDPWTGLRWPTGPSARIDHRISAADPKWIWELNRLQHLPLLAQAWLLTGDARYADEAFRQLDSWMEQNQPGTGMAWRGAFEAGVRAISVVVALQGLRDAPGLDVDRYRRTIRMLDASARQCWRERSLHSSANNHLLGEMAGLAVIALLVPELRRADRWQRDALGVLTAAASRQFLPDGAHAEQSFTYQIFAADFLLVVASLLQGHGDPQLPALLDALRRSARYLDALVAPGEPPLRYGDDDESVVLRLSGTSRRDVDDHLAAVTAVTAEPGRGRLSLDACWLSGRDSAPERRPGPASDLFARDGGLVVLRSGGRRVTMDVGPLGYLSLAAHGHADALAVTVTVGGRELIGDPGTASYYRHPSWRTAHRGTMAHGTLSVDDSDQSAIGGPFLWTRHARASVHSVDLAGGTVDAEHDGYRRLSPPVRHRRWLIAPPGENTVLVIDLARGHGTHRIRTCWPLHPELDVLAGTGKHLVSADGETLLALHHAAGGPARCYGVRGDATTDLGWWSDHLESREPAWVVGQVARGRLPAVLATVIEPVGTGEPVVRDLCVSLAGNLIEIRWREGDRPRCVALSSATGLDTGSAGATIGVAADTGGR